MIRLRGCADWSVQAGLAFIVHKPPKTNFLKPRLIYIMDLWKFVDKYDLEISCPKKRIKIVVSFLLSLFFSSSIFPLKSFFSVSMRLFFLAPKTLV